MMLAACGTTVSSQSQAAVGPASPQNGSPAVTPTGGAANTGAFSGSLAAGNSVAGASSPGAAAGERTGGSTSAVAGSTLGNEAAVHGNTITMGALTAEGAGTYERSLGFSGVATGDQAAMTKAVVNDINAHGGIAGHRIRLLIYDVKPQDANTDPATAYQAACSYFTQDNHVAAVASYLSLLPVNFYSCLQHAGVVVTTPDEEFSAAFLDRFADTVVEPNSPNYTRLMADNVDALWRAGWLTAHSKVGVVAFDTPDGHSTVDAGLVPALNRHGLKLTDSFYTSTDNSAYGQYSGPVLRFKTESVDRVFFALGGEPVIFALAAEQDDYHPYYELGSLEYPGALEQDLPADQLAGAMGIGFDPYIDLDDSHWPAVHTPGEEHCVKALKPSGQNLSTGTTMLIGAWICDDWYFFQTALEGVTTINQSTFAAAVNRVGRRFASASTFVTDFSPAQHDGPAGYRLNRFDMNCKCFQYVGGVQALR